MAEDKDKTLEFIDDYQTCRILWDQNNIDYTNKKKRYGALTALGQKHNLDVQMVKNKIKSLRSYFSKEHQKVIKNSGGASGESYQSSWFAYNSLLFILDSSAPKESGDNTYENYSATTEESAEYEALLSTNLSEGEHEFIQPARIKRNFIKSKGDDRYEEAYDSKGSAEQSNNDECSTFGQLVAHKLRKLNPRNKLLAERRISNIIFDLELQEIDRVDNSVFLSALPPN
ncbi:uncharacterized protein LOC120627805 [Pararge aegeria]|uniref:uncharacterized protein LOC120627805 n=1 Tax=Pararge aegeria TaxID=116150 RepID=UPI0019D0C4FD|nr:uncharacterized protein LOC120627805 [Pararge aegeria]